MSGWGNVTDNLPSRASSKPYTNPLMDASIMGMAISDLRGPKKPKKQGVEKRKVHSSPSMGSFASAMEEANNKPFDVVVTAPGEHCERCAEAAAQRAEREEAYRQQVLDFGHGPEHGMNALDRACAKFFTGLCESSPLSPEGVVAAITKRCDELEDKSEWRARKRKQVKRTDFKKKPPKLHEQLIFRYDGTAATDKVVTVTGMRTKDRGFVVDNHLKVDWTGKVVAKAGALPDHACVHRDPELVEKRARVAAVSLLESFDWSGADIATLSAVSASIRAMQERRREQRRNAEAAEKAEKEAKSSSDGAKHGKRKKTKSKRTERAK